jgi:hypothetical protein
MLGHWLMVATCLSSSGIVTYVTAHFLRTGSLTDGSGNLAKSLPAEIGRAIEHVLTPLPLWVPAMIAVVTHVVLRLAERAESDWWLMGLVVEAIAAVALGGCILLRLPLWFLALVIVFLPVGASLYARAPSKLVWILAGTGVPLGIVMGWIFFSDQLLAQWGMLTVSLCFLVIVATVVGVRARRRRRVKRAR